MKWRTILGLAAACFLAIATVANGQGDIKITKQTSRYAVELSLDAKVASWSIQPSEGVTVKPVGDQAAVADLVAGSYTVTAWLDLTRGRTIKITVGEPPPPPPGELIESFSFKPSVIKRGDVTDGSWRASKAKTGTLNGAVVPVVGSQQFKPDVTTTYTLTVSDGAKSETQQRIVTVSDTPPPPPPPVEGLWGMVIEESSQRTPEQGIVLSAPTVRALFATTQFRVVDKDSELPTNLKPYQDRAKAGGRLPLLFLVSKDGTVAFEGPLPVTVDAMITLVKEKQGK